MIEINRSKAISLLELAVDRRGPDFVYSQPRKEINTRSHGRVMEYGCWYEAGGAPSCGVGLALHLAGVQLNVLDDMDQVEGDTSIDKVAWVLEDNGVHLTEEALAVFTTFQTNQDFHATWGNALEAAKKEM